MVPLVLFLRGTYDQERSEQHVELVSIGAQDVFGKSADPWEAGAGADRLQASELGDKLSVIPPSARSWIGTTLPDLGRRPMRLATAAHTAVDSDDYVDFGLDSIFGARSSLFPPSFMPSILPPLWFGRGW